MTKIAQQGCTGSITPPILCLFFFSAATLRRNLCSSKYLNSSSWNHPFQKQLNLYDNINPKGRSKSDEPTTMCSPMWLPIYPSTPVHVYTVYMQYIYKYTYAHTQYSSLKIVAPKTLFGPHWATCVSTCGLVNEHLEVAPSNSKCKQK